MAYRYGSGILQSPSFYLAGGSAASKAGRYATRKLFKMGARRFRGVKRKRLNSKNMTTGRGVTFEHDKAFIYRRKRMPYKKRRRWKRLIKLDRAIDLKKCGSRTYVFNTLVQSTNSNDANQGHFNACLYGAHDPARSYINDLHYIGENDRENDPNAAQGVTIQPSTKIFFRSAVLDVTIRNSSKRVTVVGSPNTYQEDGTLEVDIYEITSSKKWVEFDESTGSLAEYGQLMDVFDEAETDIKGINNANAADYRKRGMTPWESTYALSRYGIKILKKTKYRISAGNTITYQMRDPKNRVMSYQGLNELAGGNKPGWTKWVYIVYKLVPGLPVGDTSVGDYFTGIDVGITRKYMYKVQNGTDKRVSHVSR